MATPLGPRLLQQHNIVAEVSIDCTDRVNVCLVFVCIAAPVQWLGGPCQVGVGPKTQVRSGRIGASSKKCEKISSAKILKISSEQKY
jgi:hypothetical protein